MDEQSDKLEPCGIWKQFVSALDAGVLPEFSESADVFGAGF